MRDTEGHSTQATVGQIEEYRAGRMAAEEYDRQEDLARNWGVLPDRDADEIHVLFRARAEMRRVSRQFRVTLADRVAADLADEMTSGSAAWDERSVVPEAPAPGVTALRVTDPGGGSCLVIVVPLPDPADARP